MNFLANERLEQMNWFSLSSNPNAIPLLEANLDKVDWNQLSSNPNAIPLLESNIEMVNWDSLSVNPNAIPLLKENLGKVCWVSLSENPKAFRYDYEEMKASRDALAEALMKERFHPKHITQFESWGF